MREKEKTLRTEAWRVQPRIKNQGDERRKKGRRRGDSKRKHAK